MMRTGAVALPRAGTRTPPPLRVAGMVLVHMAVLLLTVVWTVPTIGLLMSSFRAPDLVATTGWWTALDDPRFTLANYERVLTTQNLGRSIVNSLIIAIPATLIPVSIAAFAAYAFAWMSFPLRNTIFLALVGLMIVPLQTALIPVLQLYSATGLTGTFPALWLAHTGFGLPLAIYLLRNFIGALPRDLFEAAAIDGAGALGTFFRIVLPLSVPGIASLAIFQFLWVWNDLLVALIFLGGSPSVAPLTVVVSNLVNSLGQNWQLLTAAAFISTVIPLAVFFGLQRYFVRGLLAGSVKG